MPLLLLLGALLAGVLASSSAHAQAANPADPGASVPAMPYRSVLSGTRSYRPVEPLPWGDVNRRVAPPGALPPPAPQPAPKSSDKTGS